MGALPNELAEIDYPEDFLRQNLNGKATVRLDIDETGTVIDAEFLTFVDSDGNTYVNGSDDESWLRSLAENLTEAALESDFDPAVICGEPVPVQQLFTFDIDPGKD